MIKIGIIKETKVPVDNRVVLSPNQISDLHNKYKEIEFVVESSNLRVFTDSEYLSKGIKVVDDISDCDILFGVKEVNTENLIPNKHYFFFGHIAKMQPYNKPLIKKMMDLNITFTDYEYLVDDYGQRLAAFGWWAGVVGAYNAIRAYGIKNKLFNLPKPDSKFTLEELIRIMSLHQDYSCKIVITGRGRSSQGAQYVLDNIGFTKISYEKFIVEKCENRRVYTVAYLDSLVKKNISDYLPFNYEHFKNHPKCYCSDFLKYARSSDVLISCHFWGVNEPVYLTEDDLKNKDLRITVIGDVTCDILGSIKSTLRPSTHDDPFYDYNPFTMKEEKAFSSPKNITVMAVDTLPNALALDTSIYFGEALIEHILDDILSNNIKKSNIINRATILDKGKLTDRYLYLHNYTL